ncbi:hypothetical protein ACFQ0B_25050 [Nonomuraea thailandensis]
MAFTGLLMWFSGLLPWIPRPSAILVHDLTALAIAVVVLGHVRLAYRDREARRGMRSGSVTWRWARKHHPQWAEEEAARVRR